MVSVLDFECASLSKLAFSTGWFGQDVFAVVACDDGLGMTEDDCGFVASATSDVHEVGVGGWDQSFEFVLLFFGL